MYFILLFRNCNFVAADSNSSNVQNTSVPMCIVRKCTLVHILWQKDSSRKSSARTMNMEKNDQQTKHYIGSGSRQIDMKALENGMKRIEVI